MYTATITNKTTGSGKLSVQVLFDNGSGDTFYDTFETTQGQNGSWIGEQIQRRLGDLNSLTALNESISVGPFIPATDVNPDRALYRAKANDYMRYMEIARMGIILSDRPVITDLRTWLRDNFKDEYVDLF